MMVDEDNSHNEHHPQSTMKDKISTICESIQNMEMRVEELESKNEFLKYSVDQKNGDIKTEKIQRSQLVGKMNSLKGIIEGLKCLQQNLFNNGESLRENRAQSRNHLLQEEKEQTYNIECFEENMYRLAEKFQEAPQLHTTSALMDVILTFKQEIQDGDDKLVQFRKELEELELKYCSYGACDTNFKTAMNVFEPGDVVTETKKLSTDLDKLNASLQNLRQELVMIKSQHT